MLRCPLCKVVFADATVALLHLCPSVRIPHGNDSGDCRWNKIKFQFERDEKARAAFAFQMHNNYMLFFSKHVAFWKGIESHGFIVINTRTMDEFIASLDASKDAFLFQLFLKCDLYDAAQLDLI